MVNDMTLEKFVKEVFDFKTETEWKFYGTRPCIVDFYANWCQPCKKMEEIYETLSEEFEDVIDFYKVNTEDQPELSAAFGIRSIPSLLYIPTSGQARMTQGVIEIDALREIIDKILVKMTEI